MPIYVILAFLIVLFSDHPASAREMQLTIYDDGYSCPANCDAHVVFAPSDNGTRYPFIRIQRGRSPSRACGAKPA